MCARACVYAPGRVCVHACVHACVRGSVRVCLLSVRACEFVCK